MTETKPGDDDAKASISSSVDDKGGAGDEGTMASGNDNNSLAESKNDSVGRPVEGAGGTKEDLVVVLTTI